SALHESVDVEHVSRYALLSARQLHHEIQPQAARTARVAAGAGGSASLSGRKRSARDAGDSVRAATNVGRDRRTSGRVTATGGGGSRRDGGAALCRRVLPRP